MNWYAIHRASIMVKELRVRKEESCAIRPTTHSVLRPRLDHSTSTRHTLDASASPAAHTTAHPRTHTPERTAHPLTERRAPSLTATRIMHRIFGKAKPKVEAPSLDDASASVSDEWRGADMPREECVRVPCVQLVAPSSACAEPRHSSAIDVPLLPSSMSYPRSRSAAARSTGRCANWTKSCCGTRRSSRRCDPDRRRARCSSGRSECSSRRRCQYTRGELEADMREGR
jgi:hypothetical protein